MYETSAVKHSSHHCVPLLADGTEPPIALERLLDFFAIVGHGPRLSPHVIVSPPSTTTTWPVM